MKFIYLTIVTSIMIAGCNNSPTQPKYFTPSEVFEFPIIDQASLHPIQVLNNLSEIPNSACEIEDLRRLVITLNMYSVDVYNQSYLIGKNSHGYSILRKSFPSLVSLEEESVENLDIEQISNHLRELKIDCKKYYNRRLLE